MRKDKLAILGIFILVIGAIVGMNMLHGDGDRPAGRPLKPSRAGEFRGISIQLHSAAPATPYEQYVAEISQTGANTICFIVHAYQENCSSSTLVMRKDKGPNDERLERLIALARKKGLRVVLMPLVLLTNARTDEWRGKIKAANWNSWWSGYTTFVTHYAKLADNSGAEAFIVGSELISIEDQARRWEKLIADVRKVFRGKLSYSANWDHYRQIKWWRKLDVIGMTTYYDLTGGKDPTMPVLMRSWERIRKNVLTWRKKNYPKHKIMFTEVGWPNMKDCAQYPWNYYHSEDTDPAAQANCLEAFFRTWIDDKEAGKAVAGYLIWEWRSDPDQITDPDEDTGYCPYGKPLAMEVIQKYFMAPSAWKNTPASGTAAAPASSPAGTSRR